MLPCSGPDQGCRRGSTSWLTVVSGEQMLPLSCCFPMTDETVLICLPIECRIQNHLNLCIEGREHGSVCAGQPLLEQKRQKWLDTTGDKSNHQDQ